MSTSMVLCSEVRQMALSSRVNVELDATSSLKQKNAFEYQSTSETGTRVYCPVQRSLRWSGCINSAWETDERKHSEGTNHTLLQRLRHQRDRDEKSVSRMRNPVWWGGLGSEAHSLRNVRQEMNNMPVQDQPRWWSQNETPAGSWSNIAQEISTDLRTQLFFRYMSSFC